MEKIKATELDSILESNDIVVLDFSSPGCAPCKKVPPLLDEILGELADLNIEAYEVNVAEEPALAQRYFVLGVPTIIIFHKGKETKRFNSVPKKDKLAAAMKG
jgi:thioredoxin 1